MTNRTPRRGQDGRLETHLAVPMIEEATVHQLATVEERSLQHAGQMRGVGNVTRFAVQELSDLETYAHGKTVATILTGNQIRLAAGGLTQEEAETFAQLRSEYLATVVAITQTARQKILDGVEAISPPTGELERPTPSPQRTSFWRRR